MTWFGFAVISAFLSSLSAIIEKRTLSHIHALDFSIVLAITTALLSSPVLYFGNWSQATPLALLVTFGVSLFGAFAFIGITRGVRHLDISTSSSLLLLGPFITALMAYVFLGETLSVIQLFGIGLLALGTYILETQHFFRFQEFWVNISGNKYSRYTIFGLLLFGFSSLGDRIALGHLHVEAKFYTALVQLFLALQFTAIALYYKKGIAAPFAAVKRDWKVLILIAILVTGHRWMQSEAVALAAVSLVVAVKRSSALFTTIIGGELFREQDLLRKSIACLIMIVGVYLIALK